MSPLGLGGHQLRIQYTVWAGWRLSWRYLHDMLHTLYDLAPNGVLPGQITATSVIETDEELAIRRVGI